MVATPCRCAAEEAANKKYESIRANRVGLDKMLAAPPWEKYASDLRGAEQ